MKIRICSIGKDRRQEFAAAITRYEKQLPWSVELVEKELKKNYSTAAERKQEEAKLLLEAAKGVDAIITLDERGKILSSPQFAQQLKQLQENGQTTLAIMIGGADGLDESLLKKASFSLSFGKLVWPHMMVRVMVMEQLYRAHTIQTGHPYHRV